MDITENEQQQLKDPRVLNSLERETPTVVVESKENIPSVLVTVNENNPAGPDNIVSSARQQDSSLRYSSDRKEKSQQRLAPLNEAMKTKLSIINLDLPLQDNHRASHHQNRFHSRPSSSHLLPVSQSRGFSSKHDFRKSFNELKEHIEFLEAPENSEKKAPAFDKFSNELRSENGSRFVYKDYLMVNICVSTCCFLPIGIVLVLLWYTILTCAFMLCFQCDHYELMIEIS